MKAITFFLVLFISTATLAQKDTSNRFEVLKAINYDKVSLFLNKHWSQAKRIQEEVGVPGGIVLSQMALESGWGTSKFYKERKNCLGIKLNGKYCWFKTIDDCLKIYARTLKNKCYTSQGADSIEDWLEALECCGYAESETYEKKVLSIMKKYKIFYL